jgi:hypothetical protein
MSDPWYHDQYATAEDMENARTVIKEVMGEHTDATLEFFKQYAGRADMDFEKDFGHLVDNILKVSYNDLHDRCVMVAHKVFVVDKHESHDEWVQWVQESRARKGLAPINFTDN